MVIMQRITIPAVIMQSITVGGATVVELTAYPGEP
jgi:hypothetical protein